MWWWFENAGFKAKGGGIVHGIYAYGFKPYTYMVSKPYIMYALKPYMCMGKKRTCIFFP